MSSKNPEGISLKIYYAGDPGSPFKSVTGRPVKIEEIRKQYNKTKLYEDLDFPAKMKSIGNVGGDDAATSEKTAPVSYTWLRPHEICKSMGIGKTVFAAVQEDCSGGRMCSELDLVQGGLGNCWYLAALGALTTQQEQLKIVIPDDNLTAFKAANYCGAFHFRFYSMVEAKWADVVIDDRIPCIDEGVKNKPKMVPAFAKITSNCKGATVAEFWPALIEKAYAKFNGSYARIEGGFVSQAVEDFTAGLSEIIDFEKELDAYCDEPNQPPLSKYDKLKKLILKILQEENFSGLGTYTLANAHKNGALDGYSSYYHNYHRDGSVTHKLVGYKFNEATEEVEEDESKKGLGLIGPHAYSLLSAHADLKTKDGKKTYFLLKIRNPHGTHEWCGRFGDKDDKNWNRVETDLRRKTESGSTDVDEGTFWIELSDVLKYFNRMYNCYYGMHDGTQLAVAKGVWPASIQSKATKYSKSSLKYMTAYKFECKHDKDKFEIPAEYGSVCLVAFTLVMKNYDSSANPSPLFTYFLYKVSPSELDSLETVYNTRKPTLKGYRNYGREESKWGLVEPGTYVIVPLLVTAPSAGSVDIPLPKELHGKDIGYTIHLFTENKTKLVAIPPKL